MALVPRPLAYAATGVEEAGVRRAVTAGFLALLLSTPDAWALDVTVAPYVEAQRAGAVGAIAGRASEERDRKSVV